MGIKEQVKAGNISIEDALTKVDKSTITYGWLKRRKGGNAIVNAPVKSKAKKEKKYVSKKVAQPDDLVVKR